MRRHRRREHDRVERRVGQQLAEVVGEARVAELLGRSARAARDRRRSTRPARSPRASAEVARQVRSPVAEPDDADAHRRAVTAHARQAIARELTADSLVATPTASRPLAFARLAPWRSTDRRTGRAVSGRPARRRRGGRDASCAAARCAPVAYVGGITTSIAVLPFVTRHLHSADYGRYVVVTSLLLIVAVLTEGGITNLGVREFAAAPDTERREFMRNLIGMRIALSALGGVGAIAFALIAAYPTVVVEGTAIAAAHARAREPPGHADGAADRDASAPLARGARLRRPARHRARPRRARRRSTPRSSRSSPRPCSLRRRALALTVALVHRQIDLRPAFSLARWRALLRDSIVFASATALVGVYFQVVVVAMSVLTNAQPDGRVQPRVPDPQRRQRDLRCCSPAPPSRSSCAPPATIASGFATR